jgi:hypothetical protein
MAKANVEYRWINDSDFEKSNPVSAKISGLVQNGRDRILQFELPGQQLAQMSIYAENWNSLIRLFGDETDAWPGKQFKLEQIIVLKGEDKQKRKVITA